MTDSLVPWYRRTREYRTMSLRELYNYVLQCIAMRPGGTDSLEGPARLPKKAVVTDAAGRVGSTKVPVVLDVKELTESLAMSSLGVDNSTDRDDTEHDDTEHDGSSDPAEKDSSPPVIELEATDADEIHDSRRKVKFNASIRSLRPEPPSAGGNVTYRERLGGYLHPRDMRRLVTPFSSSNAPELMVRRHVVLMNCDPLRAIVLRDRLLVLVPDGADSILEQLTKRIGESRKDLEDSVFGVTMIDSTHSWKANSRQKQDSSHHSKTKKTGTGHHFTVPGMSGQGKGKVTKKSDSYVSDAGESDATVGLEESSQSDPNLNDEWDEIQAGGWIDLPFELQAVDAVLNTVAIMLAEDVETLQEAVYDAVDRLLDTGNTSIGDTDQQVMRAIKNDIKEMSSRVTNFVRALNTALDDEEDLTLMNLSRLITHPERFIQPVPEEVLNEESDEPELILETHMQQALSTSNQLELLQGQVVTSEELMAMQMDTIRNRLLYMNMVLSVMMLTVTMGALVGSLFGMNLRNDLEDEQGVFGKVVIGTLVGSVLFLFLVMFAFRKAGILPRLASY